MEAERWRGYFRGYSVYEAGVFSRRAHSEGDMPLTDTKVRKAKTREKAYRLSDSGSLFLWVTPAGGKLWRWTYVYLGKEKLMSFGKYPEVTLAIA
jgi:hypothetical protein